MAKGSKTSVPLNLYLDTHQVELLQKMIDSGLYGTITVPNSTGGRYILSHVAMNSPLSHVAMNAALSHVAMNSPLSHVAMNAALSHVAMNAPVRTPQK
jgi:hypothetical protein